MALGDARRSVRVGGIEMVKGQEAETRKDEEELVIEKLVSEGDEEVVEYREGKKTNNKT